MPRERIPPVKRSGRRATWHLPSQISATDHPRQIPCVIFHRRKFPSRDLRSPWEAFRVDHLRLGPTRFHHLNRDNLDFERWACLAGWLSPPWAGTIHFTLHSIFLRRYWFVVQIPCCAGAFSVSCDGCIRAILFGVMIVFNKQYNSINACRVMKDAYILKAIMQYHNLRK